MTEAWVVTWNGVVHLFSSKEIAIESVKLTYGGEFTFELAEKVLPGDSAVHIVVKDREGARMQDRVAIIEQPIRNEAYRLVPQRSGQGNF